MMLSCGGEQGWDRGRLPLDREAMGTVTVRRAARAAKRSVRSLAAPLQILFENDVFHCSKNPPPGRATKTCGADVNKCSLTLRAAPAVSKPLFCPGSQWQGMRRCSYLRPPVHTHTHTQPSFDPTPRRRRRHLPPSSRPSCLHLTTPPVLLVNTQPPTSPGCSPLPPVLLVSPQTTRTVLPSQSLHNLNRWYSQHVRYTPVLPEFPRQFSWTLILPLLPLSAPHCTFRLEGCHS